MTENEEGNIGAALLINTKVKLDWTLKGKQKAVSESHSYDAPDWCDPETYMVSDIRMWKTRAEYKKLRGVVLVLEKSIKYGGFELGSSSLDEEETAPSLFIVSHCLFFPDVTRVWHVAMSLYT